MTLANDSILVTPGTGATVATHLVGSAEHQVIMPATEAGQIWGTEQTWAVASQNSANVAAARTTHADLFNATGSGVILLVHGVYIIPTLAAVTGVGLTWELAWSSSIGTGGSARTPVAYDQSNTSLPAGVTFRSKPTGGASIGGVLRYINSSSEETLPYGSLASMLNHLYRDQPFTQPVVIRENQGIKVDQTTSSSVGSTNVVVVFSVR